MKQIYLEETPMLNYSEPKLKELICSKNWSNLDEYHKVKSIYEFVQNDILFGYNASDTLTATQVLDDGIGQCNTKATLFMALLRSVGIPCRLHAFDVSKAFQEGATSKIIALLAPEYILHAWVEVCFQGEWIALEGVITDKKYVESIQKKFSSHSGIFKRYAIATNDLKALSIDWIGKDTFIQKEAIVYDYGIFSSPDVFFATHAQRMSNIKNFMYAHIGRKIMTKNLMKIRNTHDS